MRLIKLFGSAALVMAVTAAIGTSSASAEFPTQLCNVHPDELVCPEGEATTEDHQVLAPGTVWRLLTPLVTVLCLGALKYATPLELGEPQLVHTLQLSITGCGTNSAHDNCTVTVEKLPLLHLLKIGLDTGVLTALDGSFVVKCPGLDCLFDLEGAQFSMGNQHTTANQVPVKPLGSKFLCPNEAKLDYLLITLKDHFILE
ncbi:MAG: hypothetical protein ACHQCI_03215 [Solirubrobacterales bacterium]